MKLLKFKVRLETEKNISELLEFINDVLHLNIAPDPYQQGKNWIDWKCNSFGLEITITYFAQRNQYSISGCRSEKVASLIPLNVIISEADISQELLDIFKLAWPDENWFIDENTNLVS